MAHPAVRLFVNWNLVMLVRDFEEGGKPENPEKITRAQQNEKQQQTQPTYDTAGPSNSGHTGGRRAFQPLRHPCTPK